MGKRGPAPKPHAVRVLEGTHKYKTRSRSVKAPITTGIPQPKCMKLTRAEKAIWKEVTQMLSTVTGLAADIDALAIASLCEAVAEFQQARDEIKRDGATCVSEKGGSYQHPAVGRKNKALERMRYLMARFGMTPSDRASMEVATPTSPSPGGTAGAGGRFAAFIESQMAAAGPN
ncbi:MAG: phage terminase small subunit P27 family [Planctomycetota bacterium]